MNNTGVTVFLISLKAGGVALNLTEASMVFMMDSWWNPSVEYQAMDRIHRLGQKRPVKVVKLVVEDSIEDQVRALRSSCGLRRAGLPSARACGCEETGVSRLSPAASYQQELTRCRLSSSSTKSSP